MTLVTDTASSHNKDRDGSHMTERILNLNLEIIYLLTGEDFEVVKKTSSERWPPSSLLHGPPDITTSTPHYQILEKHNMQTILEVAKKMMELLTGEVPIRCQDVTVYFSMEEWEYLEGHRDLYKDVMMENQPPLTSPEYGPDVQFTPKGHLTSHPVCNTEDNGTTQHSRGTDPVTGPLSVLPHMRSPDLLVPEKPPVDNPGKVTRQRNKKMFSCLPDMRSPDLPVSEKPPVDNPGRVTRQRNKKMFSCLPDMRSPDLPVPEKPPVDNPGKVTHQRKKMFPCSECNKSFTTKAYFRIHKRVHNGQRPFVCLECGRGFISKSYFHRHQKYHSELRPYPCECGKSFKDKSVLVQHLRIHSGDRPFPCSECDQSFVQKGHLRRHLRVHTGETPFLCKQCGKGFTRKDMLTLHERGHVNERPFACLVCGKRFKQQFCLVRHQKLHKEKGSFSRSVLRSNQNMNL